MAVDFEMPVLVVDDYETKVRVTRNLLNEIGFPNVTEATDAATAFALMHHGKYGLVISGAEMAPTSGYELLEQVRRDQCLKNTPFIVMTAGGEPQMSQGAAIAKPLSVQKLKTKVQAVLAQRS